MVFFSGNKRDYLKYLALITKGVRGKTICIDIDNTLADTNKELKKRGYDINCYPNPCLTSSFWKGDFGKKLLLDAKPIKNTIRIVESLKNMGAKIIFATRRPVGISNVTYIWFYEHIEPIWGKNSIFYSQNKVSLNADIYFEDNPYEIIEMLKAGKTVFAPKTPYNKIFESSQVIYYNTYINEGVKEHAIAAEN